MPTSEDFQRAFVLLQADTSTPKVANGFAMLKANYRSPGKTISAARLAQAAGYQSFSTANEQYGSFAHKVADILSYEPDRKVDGKTRWTYTLCTASTEADQNGHFQWVMRPEVADALESLKLVERIEFPDALSDISNAVGNISVLLDKNRDAYVKARIGQGPFRDRLIKQWQGCSVTAFNQLDLLIASHIKPWRDCSTSEAIDVTNGLLLIPNLDRAFDKGYISFDTDGGIIRSPQMSPSLASQLGVTPALLHKCRSQLR